MLKTDVFVWLTVNCKSLNFCSVDTLSAQLHCHMDYFIYWRHASSTHLPYSSFARNFEFSNLVIRILRSTKSQNFTILLFSNFTQQKSGGEGRGMAPLAPWVCRSCISVAKTVSKKIGTMICSKKFLSSVVALYLYKSTIPTCMDTFVMSVLVLLVSTWSCYIGYRNRYVGLLILHLLPLLNSWLIVEMLPA